MSGFKIQLGKISTDFLKTVEKLLSNIDTLLDIPQVPNGTTVIYVLKLEHDKWYIGKTDDYDRRITEHLSGSGCQWTKLHKLKDISDAKIVSVDPFDEDKFTIKLMAEKGINNVRGGIYSQIELDATLVEIIKRSIRNVRNLCLNCGHASHYLSDCYVGCKRCGHKSHEAIDCYAEKILPDWDQFKI